MIESDISAADLLGQFRQALDRRSVWEPHWQECYHYALPYRAQFTHNASIGAPRHDHLFDGTAADAVEQLAASLLANLTPPWSRWVALVPGPDLDSQQAERLAPMLEKIGDTLRAHFDRSNFSVEMHQCYLDLVVGGTACLALETAAPGGLSAFRFTAVPLEDVVMDEGSDGRLSITYRRLQLTLAQLKRRVTEDVLPPSVIRRGLTHPEDRFSLIEVVRPDHPAFLHALILDNDSEPVLLAAEKSADSPFINFRWLKAAGETYGRSPVMKSLPDIKTANKVVELILKNASIAVTGIWQADDDGVLNPANIMLVPGAIIPKAVGSAGLTPLDMPGRFDVSQLVLEDLRGRIRHALLIDRLASLDGRRMTATEVIERAAEMTRLLGATYGRLQSELLTPLVIKAVNILRARGEIPDIAIDGRLITIDYRAPLAQAQANRDVQTALTWLETANSLGPDAMAVVDAAATMRWLGKTLGVPPHLIRRNPAPVISASPTDLSPTEGA
jgi:hypothetical protein